ncbi:hypothetical protein [Sphingomonas kyeonggiensis]|uniref:Uncharacterized protein n=1 Tax=Sphingomonas kyeonggiensis TaxID=1268553 RepID=A0A7W6JXZ3_9SPHN|nr:hypothetical protein [Sphingomonas kyeonggiensis]MBB4100490.1 hypothetical protein [Sphingomonas kyeonggiensis]
MTTGNSKAQQRLQWLLDAPLFVDEALTARLFDALVRPSYEVQSRQVGEVSEDARRRLLGGEAEASYDLGLSFLTGALKLRGQVSGEHETSIKSTRSTTHTEIRVDTAGRRLEEIALVYLSNHPDRIVFIDTDGTATSFSGDRLTIADLESSAVNPPRMLAFVDIPANTPIIPMACELEGGGTALLYQKFIDTQWSDASDKPVYPPDGAPNEERRAYWLALAEKFQSRIAMEIVETSATNGKLGWIDFRMPIGAAGDAMHLHLVAGGKYYTGVFAYNLVRRGFRQGVRLVGILKAGMDLNVLAVFDK